MRKIADALGIKLIDLPLPRRRRSGRRDAAGWRGFGERLAKVGETAKKAGYGFAWHNHDFEFKTLADGSVPQEHILSAAPDIGWEMRRRLDRARRRRPAALDRAHGNRIVAVHVKDIAKPGEGLDEDGWSDVGHGTIDWAGLLKALRAKTPAQVLRHGTGQSERHRALRPRSIASVNELLTDFRSIHMARKLGVGIIGCGNISTTYFSLAPLFKGIEVAPAPTSITAAAKARAKEFGVARRDASTALLKDDEIDIVVNLTIPAVHYDVSTAGARRRQARLFGKAVRAVGQGRARPEEARREEEACASARRPTPSSAARTSWRAT